MSLTGTRGDALYDGSVSAFTWGARLVGLGLLLVAALSLLRVPGAAGLDFALAFVAAAGCLGVGAIWLLFGDHDGVLLLLFGLLNGTAARGAWLRWRRWSAPQEGANGD